MLLAFIAFLFRPSTKKEHNNLTGTEPKGAEAKIDILESDQALKIPPKETNVNELLREAENLKINENWKEFFKSLNETLGSFLSEKLEIPFSKFSINSVIDKLKELELSNEFIEQIKTAIANCGYDADDVPAAEDIYNRLPKSCKKFEDGGGHPKPKVPPPPPPP